MTTLKTKIEQILNDHFIDASDKISVESPRGDDKHFSINITSSQFTDKSRIAKNRLVYELLTPLFESQGLHAVTLNLTTPNE